jgi:ABC-type polar amino acid transport system ATPase subunit
VLASVIREEAAGGAVVVLVTHDRGFAEGVAERILVLERGRIVSQGAPSPRPAG